MLHFLVSLAVGYAFGVLHTLIDLIPNLEAYLWIWGILVYGLVLFAWESSQSRGHEHYWQYKLLDSIADWFMGMAGFVLGIFPWWLQ